MKKYEVNGRYEKMSGVAWAKKLGISIVNATGWSSIDDYNKENIDRIEFFNRAANSVLIPMDKKTRREAEKMKQILNNE